MIVKKQFTGKMNVDVDDHLLPSEDFRNAENIRIMSPGHGRVGSITKVEGNRSVSFSRIDDDPGNHTVIGAYEDRDTNRIYYFVYNSRGFDKILCYDGDSRTVTSLVNENDITGNINFPESGFVDATMAGGVLYFTDNVNEPRKIEAEAILQGEVVITDVEQLSLGATPGTYPLTVEKVNSVDAGLRTQAGTNMMRDNAFQFAYRYMYYDNSVSVLSTHSKLVNYEDDDGDETSDAAKLTLPLTETIPYRVKKVQFLTRNGNTGNWFIIGEVTDQDRINDHNNGTLALMQPFFNDRLGVAVSDEVGSKAFDLLPRTAKTLDIAKDRLFLGNILLGYEPSTLPTLSASLNNFDSGTQVPDILGRYVSVFFRRTDLGNNRYYHDLVLILEGEDYDGYYQVFVSSEDDPDYPDEFGFPDEVTVLESNKIISFDDFQADGGDNAALIRAVERFLGIYDGAATPTADEEVQRSSLWPRPTVLGVTDTVNIDGQHFKSSGRYKIGVVFYDKFGRNGGVATNDNCIVDTPRRTYDTFEYTKTILWELSGDSSVIPSWATHYQIVRTKNLVTDFFIQFICGEVKYAEQANDGTYSFSESYSDSATTNLAFSAQALFKEGLGYSYNEGDELVFWTPDGEVEERLRIEGQVGKFIITEAVDIGSLNSGFGRNTGLVEIYTPFQSGANELFYEVGEAYAITDPGTIDRSFSLTNGALVGDCYTKARETTVGSTITCEAMSVNDRRWEFWLQDTGRTNIVLYEDGQRRLPNSLVYSNAYIQSTKINGLSSYDLLDRGEVDEQAGPITKLIYTSSTNDSENVLLAVCTHNTASIYIGQTRVIDDSGDAILATSGQVIGTINVLKGDHGTDHPESVVLSRSGRVFFFDSVMKKIVRYSSNGLFPVSENGIDSFLPNLAASSRYPAAYDDDNDEYLLRVNTNKGQQLTILSDYTMNVVAAVIWDYTGTVDDAISPTPVSAAGAYGLGRLRPGRTYEWKVFSEDDATTHALQVGGTTVAQRTGTDTYEFTVDSEQAAIVFLGGEAATYIVEKQRSWHDPVDHRQKVLAYNDKLEGFVGFRRFVPDFMIGLNDKLVSWRNGVLYTHDGTTNNFYGTQYDSSIAFVVNEGQGLPMIARGISVESNIAPDFVHIRTELPYVQSSDIRGGIYDEFRLYDSVWYAPFKRDRLTPGIDNTITALNTGDAIRGQFLHIYLRYEGADDLSLRLVNVEVQQDRGHRLLTR